jgi:DNA-binding CsgD family transcriptional regulator
VPAASPAFVEACRRASGANPLLLAELVHAAVRAGVDPASNEVAVVDALVPDGVTTIVRGRLGTLDEPARVLLEVAALAGDGTRLRHLAAVVGCTVDDAGDRADRLLAQRFLDAADPVAFAHPLVQRAIADQVAPGRAGRVHRELARVHAAEHDRERACAHLLLAPPQGDDAVVRLLVEHAAAELDRGSPATAARFLARALDEPPSADRRTVLLALGEAENQLGRAEAIEHLAAAHALAATPAEAERCARSLARALAFHGRVGDAAGVLATALAASGDPGARARLRAETMLLVQNLEPSVGESPLDVPEVDGDVHAPGVAAMRAAVAYERALLWHGTAAEVSALCAGAFAGGLLEQEGMDGPSVAFGVQAAMVTGDWALTEKLLAEGEADARRRGSVRGLAAASGLRARYGVMCGRPDRAELDGRLAVALAREAHTVMLPYALAALVMGLTARGRLDEAQGLLEVHGMTGELPRNRLGTTLYLARTALACAQRRVADADRDAEALVALGWADRELPPVWTPVLVDARLLAGRTAEARRLAEVHLADARAWGAAPFVAEALLAAARAGLDEPATLAQEALDVLDGCEAPLVRATALTDLGAALRRANRRADAREPLARARELAHACGADALAERAYVELLAAGARPRRIERTGVEALTPSERRVVELAVQGMSNAQIAQHLFVTRKTVEKHLGSAYAKLQVGSRDELEAVLSGCGVVGG